MGVILQIPVTFFAKMTCFCSRNMTQVCQTYPTQHRAKFDIGPGLYEAEFHVRTRDAVSRLDKVTKPYVRGMRCIDSTASFSDH